MGLVFGKRNRPQKRLWGIGSVGELIPPRSSSADNGSVLPYVDQNTALRHSAVWAALRLRANLVSTLPVDCFRRVSAELGNQVEVKPTPVLVNPGGARVGIIEWLYSSQVELDRSGNSIGVIQSVDAAGYPARIDLVPSSAVSLRVANNEISEYQINGEKYKPEQIWHERQYTVNGCHVGLSPVAYAAYTLGEWVSVEQFAMNWFGGNAVPRARLRNVERTLDGAESATVKESWRASVAMGEPFVHGSDWEYELMQADQQSSAWLDAKKFSVNDIARFFDVPADLIDGAVSGQSVTYASISQRNLQFLIMHLGPSITRRENALSMLVPRPRFVKLNSDAILRLDPQARAAVIKTRIDSRTLAPSEARALENLAPFTAAQMAEFDRFWPARAAPVTGGSTPAIPEGNNQ